MENTEEFYQHDNSNYSSPINLQVSDRHSGLNAEQFYTNHNELGNRAETS